MFQVPAKEKEEVVANCDHLTRLKYSPVLPYAFTEHGAIMAASVLNSSRAVEVRIYVVRAFVRLQELAQARRIHSSVIAENDCMHACPLLNSRHE